jgi:hypothetical protein
MGFSCRTEVGLPGSSLVPADVFIHNLADDTHTDVYVVHPLHSSSFGASAAVAAGAAAEAQAVSKVGLYERSCQSRQWTYVAFVAERTGAWKPGGAAAD